jgi:TRAP transporter TAXI family solute receptor
MADDADKTNRSIAEIVSHHETQFAVTHSRRGFLARSVAACLGATATVATAQLRRISIGSNPAGTNFHLVAGGLAKLYQEQLDIPSIVRPYSGSSVYLPMLQRGEIPLGINSSIDSYLAFRGLDPFPAPLRNVRALFGVYPLGYMFWTRASDGLTRIEDLRGRRVVVNYRGLVGLDLLNRAILATGGLTDADIEPVTVAGLGEGARAVLEGRADAVAMGYRLPLITQMHASIPGGLRFLTMGDDEQRLSDAMPGAWVDQIGPTEATAGIEGPVRIANYQTWLNSGLHLSEDDAYRLVATAHRNWASLQRDYAVLAPVHSDQLGPVPSALPFHEGAIAYFRDAGLWSDAHAMAQVALLSSTD